MADSSRSAGSVPLLDEIPRNIEGQAELLSKHLESIHSQSGSRGRGGGGGGGGGGMRKRGGIKRVRDRKRKRGRQRERHTHERERNLFLAQAHQVRARAPENAGITRVLGLSWPGPPLLTPALHATLPC